eukprot:2682539-Pyramimonas_sp.AAC.1
MIRRRARRARRALKDSAAVETLSKAERDVVPIQSAPRSRVALAVAASAHRLHLRGPMWVCEACLQTVAKPRLLEL